MTSVQELGNDGGAAHRPRPAPVDLNQRWRHHVIVLQFPKYLITRLHIVMGHVEDMTWRGGGKMCGEETQKWR